VHARRADQARRAADLLAGNGNGKGRYLAVAGDLGSLAGVRELVEAVRQASPKGLNALVNIAGAAFAAKALSPDGYERTIATRLLSRSWSSGDHGVLTCWFVLVRAGNCALARPAGRSVPGSSCTCGR
jgi:NAD(P)-dependent dehydrogenase (short-subunit alcohol dehydrogenase family)